MINVTTPFRCFTGALLLAVLTVLPVIKLRAAEPSAIQQRADHFLTLVNASYQALYTVASEAQWAASTDVTPAHDAASEAANKAAAAFNGNPAIINEAKFLLTHRAELNELTWRQLDRVLLNAAEGPMTNPKLVSDRIAAETRQASVLNSFEFKLHGKVVTANDIDNLLESSTDLAERRAVWEASKESGVALKAGLVKLRDLRNGVAKEMGYPDYFSLQVARYGMTADEMIALNDDFMRVLRPLYLQLHT
jgi:peptidyl-dipeptidase A